MTNNHEYNIPEEGQTDWHIPLNENFEKIDADVEIRAPEEDRSEYEPKPGAKFLAQDTGRVYLGNGSEWQRLPTSGEDPTFESVNAEITETKQQSGTVFARNCTGEDLSERITDALDTLPNGRGRVRVTPRRDGEPWSWNQELTIDPTAYAGVELEIDHNVVIESSVENGYALVCDGNMNYATPESGYSGFNEGDLFKLEGGIWVNVASDPDGAFLIRDVQMTKWSPNMILRYQNSAGDATGWLLQNSEGWCELNGLTSARMKYCDRGIDMQPASVTGGSGTESFHSTTIREVSMSGIGDFGVRLRGNTANTKLDQTTVFAGDNGSVGYVFDGEHAGTVLTAVKIEDAGNTRYDGTVGFATRSNYATDKAPLLLHPVVNNIDEAMEYHADEHAVAVVRTSVENSDFNLRIGPYQKNTPRLGHVGQVNRIGHFATDMEVSGGHTSKFNGGFGSESDVDLTERSGRFVNEIHAHDGSGGYPAGNYEWDGAQWHGIGRTAGNTI
jgi:hypothetical protein